MTEREKMIEAINSVQAYGIMSNAFGGDLPVTNEMLADAFIAANIGDVTEWKEKVECAKRILQIPTLPNGTTDLSYFEYKGESIQDITRQRDEYKHRVEVVEKERDEWKERAEKAENTLKEGVKGVSSLQSAGFTINPIDVLRDSTKCLTIAQRALYNMTKKYMLAERKIATTKDGQFSFSERLIALVANEAIKQAEREAEEEKGE